MAIRQPIVTVVGHVSHGKTTLLDYIRGTAVADKESGQITQHIGATEIPTDIVEGICGSMLEKQGIDVDLPGFLFIDTPGHEAFTNLRKRGGSISDLAILVVDVNEGLKPQTKEAIQILKENETPFVIAANKIDTVHGWISQDTDCFAKSIKKQRDDVKERLNQKIYELMGEISEFGIDCQRYDKVKDYSENVAIVPISAETGEGVSDLLVVISGLVQKYFGGKLREEVLGAGKGTVLEVKKEKGLGKTLDVILYQGVIKEGYDIVISTPREPIVTKVRAIFKPSPLKELKQKSEFNSVDKVTAAAGIKLAAPNLDDVVAGMSLEVANTEEEKEKAKEKMRKEMQQIFVSKEKEGLIVKSDSIGGLEAIDKILREEDIPIHKADIGGVTKKDVMDAKRMKDEDPTLAAIFAFNVEVPDKVRKLAKESGVKLFDREVIYNLLQDYQEWREERKERKKREKLEEVVTPAKVKILPGYVFRQNNPAICGSEIIGGKLRTGYPLMKENGERVGNIKQLQVEQETVSELEEGQRGSLSLPGVTVGRNVEEGDILYTNISEEDFRKLKGELKEYLNDKEIKILKEIAKMKREEDSLWGL